MADVLTIHAEQIKRYGGANGVRDPKGLEAAVHRPQTGYYGSVLEEAAALWESLSQNHPFIDGNKRTAFSAMHRFLLLNGTAITATAEETADFLLPLYEGHGVRFETLVAWLQANTESVL